MFISFSNTHFLISLLIFTEQTPPLAPDLEAAGAFRDRDIGDGSRDTAGQDVEESPRRLS